MIAADINNDEQVSSVDLVELRKLILGIYSELPNNGSWRFVDASQTVDVANAWPFTEMLEISVLENDMMSEDYVGVKVGDINGNADANFTGGPSTENRSSNVEFVLEDLGNGQVAVKAGSNFNDIHGYQFTMQMNGTVTNVEAGALEVSADNFGVLGNGVVTTSYASAAAQSVTAGEVLFTMNVTGGSDVAMVAGITSAEAYQGESLEVLNVNLRDANGSAEYSLAQNEPNPFGSRTQIAFTLGKAGAATVTVYDVTGKVLVVKRGNYDRGANVVTIDKAEVGTSGVLYYQLESGDFTATKKMIVIE
jgi:hypothetical protein